MTRKEPVGTKVTVTAIVFDTPRWTFTLSGRVTGRTPSRSGKVQITITTLNASWLLVTHPRHGAVYVRPNLTIRG